MEAAGGTLLILGAVSIIAALVGGNLKLLGNTEFPALKSAIIRILLGAVGGVFVLWGLALVVGIDANEPLTNTTADGQTFTPVPTPTTAGSAEAVAEYVTRLNNICIQRGQEMAFISQPVEGNIQSYIDWVYRVAVLHDGWRSEVYNVARPPEAENASLQKVLSQLDVVAAESAEMYRAADAQDWETFRQHLMAYDPAMDSLGSAFRGYGLTCPW
jgi:hypothetical protein